jgi:hypothetical protein
MNKHSYYFFLFLFAMCIAATSCGDKKQESSDDDSTSRHDQESAHEEWKEMDDFHNIMAASYHPFKDSMNLAPAKTNASEMAASAEKWSSAPLPKKVDNEEVKIKLQALKTSTAAFVETAKSGDDKLIGESLSKLHDEFHEIQEAWYGGHGHHH